MTPIRSLLYSAWFYSVCTSMVLLGQLVTLMPKRWMKPYARCWSRVVLAGLPLCGVRVVVTGRENLSAGGPMLIASMHQSAFDTLLWWNMVDDCRYVVKAELMNIPLFGRLARLSGQIAVDRSGGAATMRGLLREGGKALAEGAQVVIFPEGTRVRAGEVAPLQPGIAALANRSGAIVIPVVTDSGYCWSRGLLGMRAGVIHVDIRPPLPAGLSREQMMQELDTVFKTGAAALNNVHRPVDNSVY